MLGLMEREMPYACPTGGVIRELRAASGVWPLDCGSTLINGIQVACTSPAVSMR